MKCGIVTVYCSMNCGSYLQAYALSNAVEKCGHEALLVHHCFPDHPNYGMRYRKELLRAVMRGRFAGAKRMIQRRKAFLAAIDSLNVVKSPDDVDCYIFGSDTIWDLSASFFGNHRDFFWGRSFDNARLISYAPSMGYTRQIGSEESAFVSDSLHRLDTISVRDHFTKEMLQPHCDKPISIVCDPTVLLERADYDRIAKPTVLEDFLFIYYYGKMPKDYVKAIRDYAQAKNLKTVTFGSGNPWCDISLAYDPLLFLSLYEKAAYIVTNTFHGAVFAGIYEKKFVVTKVDKPKVQDFLRLCQMSDKMTQEAEDLGKILDSDYAYDTTRQLLAEERGKGMDYLRSALKEKA